MLQKSNKIISGLSRHLFWDVDFDILNIDIHSQFIIERIVKRGNLSDFKWMLNNYDKDEIIKHIIRIRSLDDKTLHFLSSFFKVDITKFRCYN